jgi:hypothetical protein
MAYARNGEAQEGANTSAEVRNEMATNLEQLGEYALRTTETRWALLHLLWKLGIIHARG